MKSLIAFALIFVAACAFGQTTAPQPVNAFTLALAPISLPGGKGTVAGSESGLTFTPLTNLDLREDNIIGSGLQFFGGGFNYRLPVLSAKLQNASPTVNGYRFQFYITGSAGIDRLTSLPNTPQHYAFLAGGGVNYDITGSGKWSLGGEVRYAKLPGYNNNTVVVAFGPALHF